MSDRLSKTEFGSPFDVDMNTFWCKLVEECFANDINEGRLHIRMNEGRTNETSLIVKLVIEELDGVVLEGDDE